MKKNLYTVAQAKRKLGQYGISRDLRLWKISPRALTNTIGSEGWTLKLTYYYFYDNKALTHYFNEKVPASCDKVFYGLQHQPISQNQVKWSLFVMFFVSFVHPVFVYKVDCNIFSGFKADDVLYFLRLSKNEKLALYH